MARASTPTSESNLADIKDSLEKNIAEFEFILQGLENHEPFLRLVAIWKKTNDALDDSWHLFTDPVKFNEARITKFSTMELINLLDTIRADLAKAKFELAKLEHSDMFINKDVDTE